MYDFGHRYYARRFMKIVDKELKKYSFSRAHRREIRRNFYCFYLGAGLQDSENPIKNLLESETYKSDKPFELDLLAHQNLEFFNYLMDFSKGQAFNQRSLDSSVSDMYGLIKPEGKWIWNIVGRPFGKTKSESYYKRFGVSMECKMLALGMATHEQMGKYKEFHAMDNDWHNNVDDIISPAIEDIAFVTKLDKDNDDHEKSLRLLAHALVELDVNFALMYRSRFDFRRRAIRPGMPPEICINEFSYHLNEFFDMHPNKGFQINQKAFEAYQLWNTCLEMPNKNIRESVIPFIAANLISVDRTDSLRSSYFTCASNIAKNWINRAWNLDLDRFAFKDRSNEPLYVLNPDKIGDVKQLIRKHVDMNQVLGIFDSSFEKMCKSLMPIMKAFYAKKDEDLKQIITA